MASYHSEREEFIATVTKYGLPLHTARALLRQATTINRLAELACSSEAADRDRVKCPRVKGEKIAAHATIAQSTRAFERYPCLCDYDTEGGHHTSIPRITLQDHQAEQRARKALPSGWALQTSGDPRGYTLRVIPPDYAVENAGRPAHDVRAIGVPPGPSGLRF